MLNENFKLGICNFLNVLLEQEIGLKAGTVVFKKQAGYYYLEIDAIPGEKFSSFLFGEMIVTAYLMQDDDRRFSLFKMNIRVNPVVGTCGQNTISLPIAEFFFNEKGECLTPGRYTTIDKLETDDFFFIGGDESLKLKIKRKGETTDGGVFHIAEIQRGFFNGKYIGQTVYIKDRYQIVRIVDKAEVT